MYRNNSTQAVVKCGVGTLAVAMLLIGWPSAAQACNTPVYRYAMYNWAPAPYRVFYFYEGQMAEEDAEVNKTLESAFDADPDAANVMLHTVDVSQTEAFEQFPETVRNAWQTHVEGSTPAHLVYTPWGVGLFAGRLDEKAVAAMIDTPARRRLSELLGEGNAAVCLILTGPDKAANEQAEKVAAELVAKSVAGEMSIGSPIPDFATPETLLPAASGETTADEYRSDAPPTLKLAMMKVSRSDPNEKWLVRSLLAVDPELYAQDEAEAEFISGEPDLGQYAQQAMVFTVYGRGRAMPPYVGKGITVENLTECVAFLAGACSCMIKDQNPGRDLLIRYDWDTAAEAMAAEDQTFDTGPLGYQEFTADEAGNWTETASPAETPTEVLSPSDPEPESAPAPSEEAVPVEIAQSSPPPVDEPKTKEIDTPSDSFALRQAWKIGVGLLAATVAVLFAGLVFLRRQRPV